MYNQEKFFDVYKHCIKLFNEFKDGPGIIWGTNFRPPNVEEWFIFNKKNKKPNIKIIWNVNHDLLYFYFQKRVIE